MKPSKVILLLSIFVALATLIVYGDTVLDYNRAVGLLEMGLELNDSDLIRQAISIFEELLTVETDPDMLREVRFSLGEGYYALKEYEKAAEHYSAVLELSSKKDKRYLDAVYSLVFCMRNLDRLEDAARYAKTLFGTSYEDAVRYVVGSAYFSRGLYEKAVEFLHLIKKEFELYHSAKLIEGYALYRLKRYDEALPILLEASKAPENTDTWRKSLYYAALSASQSSDHKRAVELLEKLRFSSSLGDLIYPVLTALGGEYSALEDYEKALEAFQNALKVAPDEEKTLVLDNVAQCQYKLEHFTEAGKSWIESAREEKDPEEKARKYNNAISAFLKGKAYEEALKTCDEAVSTLKDRSETFLLRKGMILLDLNRLEEAKDVFKTLASPEAAYWLAVTYLRLEQFDAALEAVQRAKDGGYNPIEVARLEANAYLNQGKKEEALKVLLEILPKAGDAKPYIQLDLGMVYLAMERYVEAVEQLSKAYFDGPEDVKLEAAYHLGITYDSIEQWQRAAEWYAKAIQVDEKGKYGTDLLFRREMSLLKAKKYSDVVKELSKYQKLEPRLAYALGEAYLNLSKYDEAYAAVKDVLVSADDEKLESFDPVVASGMLYIAGKYHEVKRYPQKAQEYYRKLVELFPQSPKAPWALLDTGLILYKNGDYEESKITLASLLASYPDFPKNDVVLYYIGLIYEKGGEFEKALKVYRKIVEEYPDSSKLEEVKERIKRLGR